MQTIIKAVVSGFFACAVAACSAEAAPTTDPGSGSDQAAVEVRREEGKVTIQFGANQVVATERSGLRTVEYFEAGVWVGTVAYRPADRLMRIATPGFERTGVLPFDLDAALHDPNTALALTSALGITAEEQRVHLDRLTATDARLASDATVSSAFERHNVSAGGLSPKMWSICSSGRGALACAILTLGLCGYAMIYDCLVNP